MNPAIFIRLIYALWLLLIVYLTVAAFAAKRDTQSHLGQSFGFMFAVLAAFVLPHLPTFSFVNFAPVNPVLSSIGVLLGIAGAVVLVWARQTLGDNWSESVSAKQDHELVTAGPYRYVRHPMYTGGLIACLGSAIVCGGGFVFLLVVLSGLFLWRTGAEDKLMAQQFPDQYPAYQNGTKKLIPFVF